MTMSAPSARAAVTGIGLTRAPSISQRPPRKTGSKTPGQGVGSPHRRDERPLGEPDLVPGHELRRDGAEADRQGFDAHVLEVPFEQTAQPAAADETGAADGEIEQPHHPALGERAGEGLEGVELSGGKAAADDGADRTAGDDVRHDALAGEDLHHADMRPAAGGPAAEGEPDLELAAALLRRRNVA